MPNKKKLSVVVPIYNTAKYLPECLDSILRNSFLDSVEVILINDGSTDDSEKICSEYSKKHSGVFKYIKTKNSGLSEARNNGLRAATGDLVWFVDSDDEITPDAIECLVKQKRYHDITMVDYIMSTNGVLSSPNNDMADDAVRRYLINTPIVPIRIFKKSFLEKIKFSFEKGRYYEDSGSMYGLIKYTEDICYLKKACYIYKKRSGSITTDGKIEEKSRDRYWAAEKTLSDVPDKYRPERDYQVIKTLGLFYTFDVIDGISGRKKRKLLNEARSFMESRIPKYWNNDYLKRKTLIMRGYRLYLKCLHLKLYFLCRIISVARKKIIG